MRVLVVEDEPDLLDSLLKALREDGYAADGAGDGEDGLYKAQNYEYDAVVLDIMLPRIDGWELLRGLRKTKKTPVLMLTARDAVRTACGAWTPGPMITWSSRSTCRNCWRGCGRSSAARPARPTPASRLATWSSTPPRARCARKAAGGPHCPGVCPGGVPGAAPRRGRHPHHALRTLFDENDSTLSNLLDVHVSNIRKKLGHDFITTRRGHGYCVDSA